MCRGCITGGCSEYLDWLAKYHRITRHIKELEKDILVFEDKLDNEDYAAIVSKFRRQIIRLRKEFGKADIILNEINIKDKES